MRRSFDEMDDLAPGRSLLRRDDPARVAARSSRLGQPAPTEEAESLAPPQRRTDNELGILNSARRALRGDDQEAIRGRATVAEPKRPAEMRPAEIRPAEIRPAEIRPADARPTESRATEARLAEIRPAEPRAAESRKAEVRPAASRAAGARKAEPRPAEAARRTTLAGDPELVRRVNPFELPDPRGYSHATVARGQIVFVAGQTGVDLDGRIVDGGMVKQFDRAVQNLLTALAAAGGSPEYLASVTVQVTSIDEYKANSRPIGHVWRARLGGGLPALTLIEVRRFWDADALVQIEGHAVLP